MRVKGKVVLVTGAARGLGFTMAEQLLKEGAEAVVVNDLDDESIHHAVQRLKERGFDGAVGYKADVAVKEQVSGMLSFIEETYGRLDVLVNNAGGSLRTPKMLHEIEEHHWDLVIDVNMKGTFFCMQYAIPLMKKGGKGSIINVASMAGRTAGTVSSVAYAASKGGVIAMTRRVASEAGPEVRVNAIAPGMVLSGERVQALWDNMTPKEQEHMLVNIPLKRLGNNLDQAKVVVFLASDDSEYMTGTVLDVNGGRFIG